MPRLSPPFRPPRKRRPGDPRTRPTSSGLGGAAPRGRLHVHADGFERIARNAVGEAATTRFYVHGHDFIVASDLVHRDFSTKTQSPTFRTAVTPIAARQRTLWSFLLRRSCLCMRITVADPDAPRAPDLNVRETRPDNAHRVLFRRASAAASGLVLLDDGLRNPTACRDRHTVGTGPFPQLSKIEVALRHRCRTRGLRFAAPRRRARPSLASSCAHVAIERLAERRGVLLRQVDLVARAVQGKRHRFRGLAAVKVIDELLDHFSGHVQHSLSTEGCAQPTAAVHVGDAAGGGIRYPRRGISRETVLHRRISATVWS